MSLWTLATIGGTGIKKVLGTATTDRNLAVNCTLVKRGRPCRARFVQLRSGSTPSQRSILRDFSFAARNRGIGNDVFRLVASV
jgi:hypothetical protein